MYYSNESNQIKYCEQMEQMKDLNRDYILLKKSWEYVFGRKIYLLQNSILTGDFQSLFRNIRKSRLLKRAARVQKKKNLEIELPQQKDGGNYFSHERIAIYTCIIGNYDQVCEPACCPDNCDYFLITDIDRNLTKSIWKQVFINDYQEDLKDYNKIEINRYFKMHPEKVFENYQYSVYVDGNIKIITDFTEMINKIGKFGIAVHIHGMRSCVYDEADIILALKKESKKNLNRHLTYLEEMRMPRNYGLAECNVIARNHHSDICKKIMNDWWNDFLIYAKRDQLSFPSVLYRNNILVAEVAVLGSCEEDYSFRVEGHKN